LLQPEGDHFFFFAGTFDPGLELTGVSFVNTIMVIVAC
jgi:hypothetical protein